MALNNSAEHGMSQCEQDREHIPVQLTINWTRNLKSWIWLPDNVREPVGAVEEYESWWEDFARPLVDGPGFVLALGILNVCLCREPRHRIQQNIHTL